MSEPILRALWRCSVIADWVRDTRAILKKEKPEALLGIYHCPWDDDEFNGARYRILGLDYDMLKDLTDIFSPMVTCHGMSLLILCRISSLNINFY